MKKGTKCVVQTINLSNPKTCTRPKVQRFVSADSSCDSNRASDYWITRPAAVKVCSWNDVQQKKYPPKVKFCEPSPKKKSPPLSTNIILCRIAMFFIKSAIIAGFICWTYSEGLWGNNTETEELYYRMINVVFPDRPISLPRLEEIKYSACETYNHMLVKGMDIIVCVPREIHRKLRELLFSCDKTKEKERKRRSRIDENSEI